MSPDPDSQSKVDLERQRVPLERKISLKFKEFRGFITEVSANLSLGGMFIRTTSPKPPGTIFDFELSLTDDYKLVQGIGEVMWIREADGGPDRPPGMGVRFLDLSPDSRKLIERIVEEHVQHGGVPFELEPPTFPPPVRPVSPPAGARPGPAATARPAPAAPPVFHATAAPMASPPTSSAVGPRPGGRPAGEATPQQAASRPAGAAPGTPASRSDDTASLAAAPAPPAAAGETPARWQTAPAPLDFGRSAPRQPLEPPLAAAAAPLAAAPTGAADADVFPDLDDLAAPELEIPDLGLPERDASALLAPELVRPELEAPELEAFPPFRELGSEELLPAPADATELLPLGDGPWTAPEAPAAPRPSLDDTGSARRGTPGHLPAGFDEVARAFAAGSAAAAASSTPAVAAVPAAPPSAASPTPLRPSLVDDETVRMVRGRDVLPGAEPAPPPSAAPWPARPEAADSPRPVASGAAPVGYPQPAPRTPPPRRRSFALPVAVALTLLLLGAGAALYFAFPQLLPDWLPRPSAPAVAGAPAAEPGAPAGPAPAAAPAPDPAHPAPPGLDGGGPAAAGVPGAPLAGGVPAPPADPRAGAPPADGPFTAIEEIWGQQTASGTLVTLVADGAVPAGAYTTFRLDGGNPREVVRLRGVGAGFGRPTVPIGTGEVKQVRVGYHAKPSGNELHVVVDLTSPRIRLTRVVATDNRLELLLSTQ